VTSKSLIGLLGLVFAASSAQAACKDDIAQLETKSRDKTTTSIANSSGGQGVAARREASQGEQSVGDQAMQAKIALNDAKVALGKGDEAGCEAALAKARTDIAK